MTLKVLEIYLLRNIKMLHDEFLYDKAWIPTRPYMLFRLGKLWYICCLFCIEFSQALFMPYERFVMLLKSRSRTHHPNMHYSYTRGRRKNMPFHLDAPKNMIDRFPIHQINAPSSCSYLSKVGNILGNIFMFSPSVGVKHFWGGSWWKACFCAYP